NVTANHVISESALKKENEKPQQLDLFTDYETEAKKLELEKKAEAKEKSLQHTILDIKHKFGKNAILKGANLQEGAMTIERNQQIGGHKA
ncbi:MAG: DNA methylase, partial [Anaerovibrio sp.]|nr:DNA methylase [Anaerovibrio sp.]